MSFFRNTVFASGLVLAGATQATDVSMAGGSVNALSASNRRSSSSVSPRARNCGSKAAPPIAAANASPKPRAARRVGR